jgi:hypothetical protein
MPSGREAVASVGDERLHEHSSSGEGEPQAVIAKPNSTTATMSDIVNMTVA